MEQKDSTEQFESASLVVVDPWSVTKQIDFDEWAYVDDDPDISAFVHRYLGPSRRLISYREFQELASSLRAPFVQWVDEANSHSDIHERLTQGADRNTFAPTALFLHVVWLQIILDKCRNRSARILIISGRTAFWAALRKLAEAQGFSIECRFGAKARLHNARLLLLDFLRFAKELGGIVCRSAISKILLGRGYLQKVAGVDILIDIYLHQSDIIAGTKIRDRYFPGLAEWYRSHGFNVAYYPFLFRAGIAQLPVTYKALKQSAIPFVLFERFITFADIILAVGQCFRLAFANRPRLRSFCGIDCQALVDRRAKSNSLSALYPFLLLRTPQRLVRFGIKPAIFIDWYENQTIDKATHWGWRKAGHPVRHVGVRQFIPMPNLLSEFTTDGEIAAEVAPREQWVCGDILPRLLSTYSHDVKYRVVPALRFSHLFQDISTNRGRGVNCLVLLTHTYAECVEMLQLVSGNSALIESECQSIIIKAQPNAPKVTSAVRSRFSSLPGKALRWSDQGISELLRDTKLVISGGTSAAIEAICYGVPVILMGSRAGLDANPLEQVDRSMWQLIYSQDDFESAFHKLINSTVDIRQRLLVAESARQRYFEVTNEETMQHFLPNLTGTD
ncbi:MAG: hypothetical protein OEL88_02060 [Sterolibacteriaceae bacterium MAG5]|nr:hypothetical protein [Candidatus Nitricoxidireducens bremensis]